MVTSKKPAATRPADQFISLIKAPDKKEVAAQKTVTKESARKKQKKTPKKRPIKNLLLQPAEKAKKAIKPATKPLQAAKPARINPRGIWLRENNRHRNRRRKQLGRKTRPNPLTHSPSSSWPFPLSGSDSSSFGAWQCALARYRNSDKPYRRHRHNRLSSLLRGRPHQRRPRKPVALRCRRSLVPGFLTGIDHTVPTAQPITATIYLVRYKPLI